MALFNFNDTVRVKASAPAELRPAALASVVMIHEGRGRVGEYFEQFPDGVIYTVEFEDGHAVDLHEQFLEKGWFPSEAAAKI